MTVRDSPANKDNMMVLLVSEDYHNKMQTILSGPVYRKLTIDVTSRTGRHMPSLYKEARQHTGLVKETSLTSVPPRLHGLLKIQKHDVPLRHSVNHNASTMYGLAKYLIG
jgi:hypothetical protein